MKTVLTGYPSLKQIIITLCCILLITPLYAQENKLLFQDLAVDTILEKKAMNLDSIAFSMSNSNPDSALLLAKKAMKVGEEAKSYKEYAMALNITGLAYFSLGNKDSAIWYVSAAKAMFHEMHKPSMESRMFMNLSSFYESLSDYPKALQNLSASMQLANQSNDSLNTIVAEKMIGIIYRKQGYFDNSKLHLQRAVKLAGMLEQQKYSKYYGDALSSLASLYVQMNSIDTAKMLYRQSLNVYQNANDLSGVAMVNENIGLCFTDSNTPQSLDSALFYYHRAYNTNISLDNKYDAAYEKMLISNVLIQKKQYRSAEKNLKESLPVFDSMHIITEAFNGYSSLSILYDSMHDYKKAYQAILIANVYSDTLNEQDKNRAIADMLVKYEANKKDTTIALLNARSELAERKLSKTRIVEFFSLILIALSVTLTLVLLNRNNIKQRYKQLQMRNQIASDLHDEVGSSLSSILMLGKMASVEKSGKNEIINKINSNTEEMIERISDIVWATNPKYDDGENFSEKISNYIMQVNQLSKVSVNLDISNEITGMKFHMEVRRCVFLIIKEAINNILKHANASVITIIMRAEHKKLYVQVSDNGNGFDIQRSNEGNGLESMYARAENLGGRFTLTSAYGKGTNISIIIPL